MSERQGLTQGAYEAWVAAKPFGETALDWDELDDEYVTAWRRMVDFVVSATLRGGTVKLAIEAARHAERQTIREHVLNRVRQLESGGFFDDKPAITELRILAEELGWTGHE